MKSLALFSVLAAVALVCVAGSPASAAHGEESGGFGLVVSRLYDPGSPGNMGPIVVLRVRPDGEAYRAGIQEGDIILEIDGRQTAGREFGDIAPNSIRGKADPSSDLKIKRLPADKTIAVTLRRTFITYAPEQEK